MDIERQRQERLRRFLAGTDELVIGRDEDCPLPLARMIALDASAPEVVAVFDGGLTAQVARIRAGGRDWSLKRARAVARVRNVDGATSFLNELERRADFTRLKADRGGGARWQAIVDTRYASLRQGLIVSPWIDGEPVAAWDERSLLQLFAIGYELILEGLFEWDYCPGNILGDGRQIRLFDFGYMYRFDPLRHFNSAGDGCSAPQFHLAERFETRNFSAAWLALERAGTASALAAFRLEKTIAVDCYRRLRHALSARGAEATVLDWLGGIIGRWEEGLAGDLDALYIAECWRSHLLDVDDDLHGRSCTPLTLARIDWLDRMLQDQFATLRAQGVLAATDAGLSRAELLARNAELRDLARSWQLASS